MIIFYSGHENAARPEKVIPGGANIMLSFDMIQRKAGRLDGRFKAILKSRKKSPKKRSR